MVSFMKTFLFQGGKKTKNGGQKPAKSCWFLGVRRRWPGCIRSGGVGVFLPYSVMCFLGWGGQRGGGGGLNEKLSQPAYEQV